MKNVLFTTATSLSIISTGFLLHSISRKDDGKILADVGAEIRVVACSVTSARTSSLRNAELVENIVNVLPADVHVFLLVNDRGAFAASSSNRRVTFVDMPPESDISIWPQDPFVVVQGAETTRLVIPRSFDREDDERMPKQLAATLNLEIVQSDLQFEGGNIVCGRAAVFIGFDTIQDNAASLDKSNAEVVGRFRKLFGRPVVVVGDVRQSVGHIDLIVTPLSQQRIAVADTRTGASLASAALQKNSALVDNFERQCEQQFFGHADVTELRDRDGQTISCPAVVGQTGSAIDFSLRLAPKLDRIAQQLAGCGYNVVRVPALIPDQALQGGPPGGRKPQYPLLSYVNVLTESRRNQPIVYLPQFGFRTLYDAAQRVWRELGYKVKPVAGFATSAMYGGAMRCCTKVLLRN